MLTTREALPATARRLCISIACLLLSACGWNSRSDPSPQIRDMAAAQWSAYKAAYAIPEGGLAILIMAPGGTWSASTDLGDIDVPGVHYRIGSNTKSFTAASIMLLYQEGKLDIDDTITANIPGRTVPYVPDTPAYAIPYKNLITIRRLLDHTAGVYDHSNFPVYDDCDVPYHGGSYVDYILAKPGEAQHTFTFEELIAVNAICRQSDSPPGTRPHYSNIGYDILGTIIERVSGLSYSDFVMRRLVEPNGLRDTTVPHLGSDQELPSPSVLGHFRFHGQFTAVPRFNASSVVSEGNIVSTPTDVARWIRNLVNGDAGISKRYADMMRVCRVPADGGGCYGFGIFHEPPLGWGHNGGIPGFLSYMMYNPDDDVAVVVFANTIDGDHLHDEMLALVCIANKARQILGYAGQCASSLSVPPRS